MQDQDKTARAFPDLKDWRPWKASSDDGEQGPEPFDDCRGEDLDFCLQDLEETACPECKGFGRNASHKGGDCPTCRGYETVVPFEGGYLAQDGLARFH